MKIQHHLIFLSVLLSLTTSVSAQEHIEHHPATSMDAQTIAATEPGQGAFAAIAEIVQILQNDPNTDWSKVNIGVLREHLVDMDLVSLDSAVETSVTGSTITFKVTGTGRTKLAIQTMVIAHADQLRSSTNWNIQAHETENGAVLVVSSDAGHEFQKLRALGFYGVMATGAHHQEHHMMMARGLSAH